MNVLYKYCDQLGIVEILGSLELKLPNVSEVNDPFECLPIFHCPNDETAIEKRYLSALKRRNIPPPKDYKRILHERFVKGDIQKYLAESQGKFQEAWNRQKGFLLSVSKTAKEPVMWAHYAEMHTGAVIGIDFDNIHGVQMKIHSVDYSKKRPKINILEEPEGDVSPNAYQKAIMTKSSSWRYEKERRVIFLVDHLEGLKQHGLACLEDFNGRPTWFLRLNPESIRKVVFGLYTEKGLKSAIRKLIGRPELQHVKLYQTEKSETYTLKLIEINRQ